MSYEWHKADEPPPNGVVVWVSIGGGTALLARYNRGRWENVIGGNPALPFLPCWWQHLKLPESPGPLQP